MSCPFAGQPLCWHGRPYRGWYHHPVFTKLQVPAALAQVGPFAATAALLEDFDLLNQLHLDAATGQYRDWGNHTEGVQLRKPVGLV